MKSIVCSFVFLVTVSVTAFVVSSARAEVLYRETFGRPTGGNLPVINWDWTQFRLDGGVHTGGNVNGANPGKPTDVANTPSAGPNSDGTTEASEWGWHYFDGGTTGGAPRALSMTTEYSFNPADYDNNLKFSWWQANGNAAGQGTTLGGFRVAVRQGGSWFASAQVHNNTVNNDQGGAGMNTLGELMEFDYDPAAANWLGLVFDGNYTLGATHGTGTATASTTAISLGAAPGSALSGPITAFGLYRDTFLNNSRFDTFSIESTGPPPIPGDTDGDGTVELEDDFGPIRDNFRKAVTSRSQGDLVQSGFVDFNDFRQWKGAYVAGGGSLVGVDLGSMFSTVPEPGAGVLLVMGTVFLATHTRQRGRRVALQDRDRP